ncbi:MAG: SMC-Scp complex subunit ScpB [Deltaproteobacteria bacterium]|nr:SMC-Scp complex subunit ScpB [Deltaproteobacteria bacterium]
MTKPLSFIIESLLFVAEEPLSVQQLKAILETEDADAIRSALKELADEYDRRRGGFEIKQVAGGFQFRTRSEYSEWVKKLLKPSPAKLSRAALETLAIIAYKQPIIRADVEHIRGVDCGGVLRMLLEKKLVRVLGRKDIPGRPMIYGTTRQFLEVFNLKDLRDLPSPKEIESMGTEVDNLFSTSEDAPENQPSPRSTEAELPVADSDGRSDVQKSEDTLHPQENEASGSEDRLLKQQNGHGSLAEDEKIPIAPSDAPMPLMTVEDAFSPDPPSQQNDTDATSDHTDFDEDSQESHYDRKKS